MNPILLFSLLLSLGADIFAGDWEVGFASVKITPEQPTPLVGYAARTNVFKEVDQDIYAKAMALKDADGHRALLVTADICLLSPTVAEPIAQEIAEKTGLQRPKILISVSHTHSGPPVSFGAARDSVSGEAVSGEVVEYTRTFQKNLVKAAKEAFSNLAPAKLSYGAGVANFVMNRREYTTNGVILGVNPRGYVDRTVPVLRIDSPEGELRGVLFGYACHGTTLPSDSLVISPDYPGYARNEIQKQFPRAEALFIAGLGGSANPYPRRSVEDARQHGAALGTEVCRVLRTKMRALAGPLQCEMDNAELPLLKPSKTELDEMRKRDRSLRGLTAELAAKLERGEPLDPTHKAPVAVWQFGVDLTLIALSGEVVGEYIPLLEHAVGPLRLWTAAYCNAVSGYIPTRRILEEGGYECRGLYEGIGLYAPEAETILLQKAIDLTKRANRK